MKGDFLGFSFDGIHSSQLGITHVSSSDRYDENLFPEVKDKTIEIPNNHGEYYYGSTYGTRTFEIEIAYDSITELQFRKIRHLFGTRKVCELIFDERPYKVYYAKIESPIEMSYVCFDEPKRAPSETEQDGVRVINRTSVTEEQTIIVPVIDEETGEPIIDEETGEPVTREETQTIITGYDIEREQIKPWVYEYNEDGTYKTQRIYKGEGKISLICYQPFAHQLFKIKELYERAGENEGNLVTTYTNVDEWIESSGILTEDDWNTYHIDQVINTSVKETIEETITIPAAEEGQTTTFIYHFISTPVGDISVSGTNNYVINENEIVFTNSTTTSIPGVVILYQIDDESIPYTYAIPVYNPGDLNVGFCLYIPFINGKILPKDGKSDIIINGDTEVLVLKPIERKGSDIGIMINTKTHLIEGVTYSQDANVHDYRRPAWQTTGNLYNEYIKIGEFPYIKRNDWALDSIDNKPQSIYISCKEVEGISIYYDYLYF